MKIATAIVLGVALAATGTVALASRNTAGTYSLPAGNPVSTGRVISSSWANTTLGDIAQGLTDSLDRNGSGSMSAPLKLSNGTVTAPAISFSSEPGTGLYRIGAGNPGMSVLGSKRQEWTSTGTVVTGTLGVSGDSTLSGNVTVGGTLGVTGAMAATTFGSGATISAGSLLLSESGTQAITRTGGPLVIQTTDASEIDFFTNGVEAAAFQPGGDLWMGAHKIVNLATPSASTDAANMGYVDGAPPAYTSFGSLGTNWTVVSGTTAYTRKAGFVSVALAVKWTGATSTPPASAIATLPVGYRPLTAHVYSVVPVNNGATVAVVKISATDGTIIVFSGTMNLNDNLFLNVVFPGA